MQRITLLYLLATILFSCKKDAVAPVDKTKTLITVDYSTDITPDSIVITDTDYKHWHGFKKFSNPLTTTFNKSVPHNYTVAFFKNREHYTGQLWLNNGNPKIKLQLKNKEVFIDTVYNAPIYYELFTFGDQLDAYHKNQDTVARDEYLLDKINEHFNDAFSNLASFNYMSYHQNNPKKLQLLLNKIEKQNDSIKYGLSTPYPALQKMLNVSKISNFSPFSYTLMDAEGTVKKPDASSSKLYLIDFWFVRCKPCVADHKIINQRLNDFKKLGIEVIGISIDQKYTDWSAYISEHNYSWSNYKQVYTEKSTPVDDLGVTTYPTYILVNDKGQIISKRYNYIKDVIADYIDKK